MAPFPYIPQLKQSNLNLSLFGYGSLKHLLLLANGTLPGVSKAEFISRLQHVLNVFEITCLGSGISDFDSISWRIAKSYDLKIVQDIQEGYRSWETLGRIIDPSAWQYARDLNPTKPQSQTQSQSQNKSGQNSQKLCTTWNTFKNEGCHYEFNNPGETCVYSHQCSACRQRGFPNRRHKAINCRDSANSNQSNATLTSAAPIPAVTSV